MLIEPKPVGVVLAVSVTGTPMHDSRGVEWIRTDDAYGLLMPRRM